MCAQHGRDVMGWKSPVGVPRLIRHIGSMITTSRRQGQGREDLSGGSRSANVRGDGQKLHRRPGLRASWHPMAKPIGYSGQGKCSACARKHRVLTWGDLIGERCAEFRKSSGDRCVTERSRRCGKSPAADERTEWQTKRRGIARRRAIAAVTGQESAEAIVAALQGNAKGRT